ncbi:helix-turn-helix transcriptional regulator [Lampropedia aestuarii]|nr:helix-turn-helix domain-containing protein [Lampropedia aestuarii]
MMTTEPVRTYRVNRASELLDVSRATIYRLVRAKKLVLVKVGERASGITADSLERHIASGMTENGR